MKKNLKLKCLLIIGGIVAGICVIALAVLFFTGGSEDMDVAANETATPIIEPVDTPVSVTEEEGQDDAEDSLPEYAVEPDMETTIYDFDGDVVGYMTYEEAEALSDEELGVYLEGIPWGQDFQEFIENDEELHNDLYYYQKLYLSMNPDFFIPGFGNPYANVVFDGAEDALRQFDEWEEEAENALYDSTPVSYVYDDEGNTITLGWAGETDGKGIYLVPTCSNADLDNQVAFYFIETPNIETSMVMGYSSADDTSFHNGVSNFIVSYQIYSHLYASTYNYEEDLWRLRWVDQSRSVGSVTESDTIYGRMLDLNTGEIVACFHADVKYDAASDCYYLSDIYDGAAALSSSDRKYAISGALEFMERSTAIQEYLPSGWVADTDNAIIEALPREYTYFDQLYGTNELPMYASSVTWYISNVYAMNLPIEGFGNITLYFGPELQVMYSFAEYEGDLPTQLNLTLFGFDALCPSSTEDMMIVDGYVF